MGPGPSNTESAGSTGCPRDSGPVEVDFAVVGGGYVGLHTAIELARLEPGARIVVLEREHCGAGASGRNGGQVHSWWNQAPALATICGRDEARLLSNESAVAIDGIRRLSERRPEVAFQQSGWLWTATTEAQEGAWNATIEECGAQSAEPFRVLDEDELRSKSGTEVVRSGVFEAGGGTVDPQGLVSALKAEALEANVKVLERTPALEIKGGRPGTVVTPANRIEAGQVIVTTNAWAAREPGLRRFVFVVGSDIVLTDPLDEVPEQSLPEAGVALCDSQPRVLYWTLRGDRRLAFGRGGGRIAPFNRLGRRSGGPTRWRKDVASAMKRVYPQLVDVTPSAAWSGAIDRTVDGFPIFGSLGGDGPLYGIGWSGSGVVGSVLGGKVLASLATRRDDLWSRNALVARDPIPLPPEPIRTAGAHIVRSAVRRAGRAAERGRAVDPLTRKVAGLAPALEADPSAEGTRTDR